MTSNMTPGTVLNQYTFDRYKGTLRPDQLARLVLLFFGLACLTLGCSVSSSSGVASVQQAAQASTGTGTITPQFFGMVVKNSAHQPTVAAGSRRLWDSGVTWASIEPSPGVFVWSALDGEVAAAETAGAEVTLTLGMTPSWASSQPALASAYGPGATAMPASLSSWDDYLTAVASRYKGRIAAYEVWNAPSDANYWSGTASQLGSDMATLAAHVSTVVRPIDPAAAIVGPAFEAEGLQTFLAAGGSASIDVVGASLSLAGQAPEAVPAQIAAIRSALANTSAETKPLQIDQQSWTLPAGGLSETDQAAYVARSLVLNAGFGVSELSWYAWDENVDAALRLTDANGQPTAAALSYGVMEGWLSGAAINGCSANAQQLWSCQLVRGGRPGWILWSAGGAVQASGMGMSTVTDLQGNEQALAAGANVAVGGSPILLQ